VKIGMEEASGWGGQQKLVNPGGLQTNRTHPNTSNNLQHESGAGMTIAKQGRTEVRGSSAGRPTR
jgi:hypothetical protein